MLLTHDLFAIAKLLVSVCQITYLSIYVLPKGLSCQQM